MRVAAAVLVTGLVAVGCSSTVDEAPPPEPSAQPATPTNPPKTTPADAPSSQSPRRRPIRASGFDAAQAMAVVRHLAGDIGPRHGTSAAYRDAARWTAGYFERLGYDVRRQRFPVPAGTSWGVPIAAGRSSNVIATPTGFDPAEPHLVVGAHLDTVPRAPGAEDNASGVGVLLAAAAAAADRRSRLPVVWVAFGAEEPRGAGDDDHHYGSRAYVAELPARQREALRGMVSLDRVGVGATVPIGSAHEGDPVQRALLDAARRTGTSATSDPFQRSSDHWSFVRDGLPGARLGSTSYAAYHSPGDVPSVIDREQLARAGTILLAWLAPSG